MGVQYIQPATAVHADVAPAGTAAAMAVLVEPVEKPAAAEVDVDFGERAWETA